MTDLKKAVGYQAAEYVEDSMVVGLGTGSTVAYLLEGLGKRLKAEDLSITAVTTSNRTKDKARSLGIPILPLDQVERIDLTIDGADEVDPQFNGIKGGGGAHLYEKIVAQHSKQNIWIVDESKLVDQLGAFPLPVEVVKFGSQHLFDQLVADQLKPSWRLDDQGQKYLTDDNNYIIDLKLDYIDQVQELAAQLKSYTGLVEHGLFIGLTDRVLVGRPSGVEVLTK